MAYQTELGNFPGTLIAKCIDNINPFRGTTEEGLEVGKKYEVEAITMGQSYTSVYLKDVGEPLGFNSVYFRFYEDGKKLNIYNDKRFNPYL